jgi:outer membrane receptor for ferrienterochelin and colicins
MVGLTGGVGGGVALSLMMCGPALAQGPEILPTQEAQAPATGTQVFDAAYLAQYTVNNAEDLLRRLPGVTTVLDGGGGGGGPNANQRGLGAGSDQILIDGKRLASKANNVGATLRRIPATSVDRVELIRGSSDAVQSEGLVINVVLKRGVQIGGAGNFEVAYRFSDMGYGEVDGLVSYANTWGPISYVLGYERQAWSPVATAPGQGANDFSKRFRDEVYYYPSGAVSELRPQKWRRVHQKDIITANANYDFGQDESLRLNLLYQPNPVKQVDVTAITRFNPAGVQTTRATEQHYNKNSQDTFEVGGELEKRLGPGTLNVIGLYSRRQTDLLDFRMRHEAAGPIVEVGRSANAQQAGEDVARATYTLPVFTDQTLTLGVEGARNFLTQEIEVFADLNRDGRLEPVVVPTALAKVNEKRAELSVSHNWRINPKWTLDSALFFEISRINTNYPAIPVRTLSYLKPRLDLRYNVTPVDRLRLKVEKTMGQLDFANFVPAYNIVDSRIDLGNPQILPTKTWLFEVGYERRLPDNLGTLGLRAWHQLREGTVGFVPFGVTSTGLPQSARGNLPTILLYASEVSASLRLSMLGLPGAQFNARAWQQYTRYTDIFTGVRGKAPSPFSYDVVLGFRHDVASWKASYGVDYLDTGGVNYTSDVRTWDGNRRLKRFGAYVERALWGDYSIRIDAYNVNGVHEERSRRLYTISQAEGTLSRTEFYDELRDRRFAVRLRGKF